MCSENAADWSKAYNETLKNPPESGAILGTLDGTPVKLTVEIVGGSPPFIYGRIYVPETVGVELGWYLQSEGMDTFHGWKCILMPRARADLVKKIGLDGDTVMVKSLRLIRASKSGKSFLCEVHEF
jgi:hypothetical protein